MRDSLPALLQPALLDPALFYSALLDPALLDYAPFHYAPWLAFSPWMRPSTSIGIFHRISESLLIWIFLQTLIDGRGIWVDYREIRMVGD